MGNLYAQGAWDDIQGQISSAKLPPANTPTWRNWDHGISGGVTFPVLGFAVGDYMYLTFQSYHAMELETILDQHIHYSTPTDGTADKFKFQMDVVAAPVNGTWAVPTGSPFTHEVTMADDYSTEHQLAEICEVPGVNTSVSTIYKVKVQRIAASADEYSGEIYISMSDGHYQKDGLGSAQEYSKDPA
jgi:hypothetical protein